MVNFSIVIPAKNEELGLSKLLPLLKSEFPSCEIIVVNDGSTDGTSDICKQHEVLEITHKYSKGNGAAIKAGARVAGGDALIFMDGDGQHRVGDVRRLISEFEEGYDMIVGSRDNRSQASLGRLAANRFYNFLASWMVGHKVEDLTSGLRVLNADKFREFLFLLPNGFSYPTTITMAFFRAGYSVKYSAIKAEARLGVSHINLFRDGIRFLLIIFKIGTLFSPLKIFAPISILMFLMGISYYCFTYITMARFTNMSALLFTTSLMIFLLGLVSEQVTQLLYSKK